MPLNNSIQKNSDTFFATSNITANFTSPVTSTTIQAVVRTNAISVVGQANNLAAFTAEYYNNTTTDTYQPIINLCRSFGTKASPSATSGTVPLGQINFCNSGSAGIFSQTAFIRGISVTGAECLTLGIGTQSSRFIMRNFGTFVLNGGNFTICPAGSISSDTNLPTGVQGVVFEGANSFNEAVFKTITRQDSYSGAQNQPIVSIMGATTNIGSRVFLCRTRSGTGGSGTVAVNDELGAIYFNGSDGTTTSTNANFKSMAAIQGFCDGSVSATDVPGRLVFSTTPDGTQAVSESMRIDNAGRITQIRQPSFSASLSADVANATGDGTAYTVAFDTEQYDQGSNFAANTFTAPIAGKYRFAYTISVDDLLVGHTKLELTVGGRVVERCNPYAIADSDGFCLLSGMVDLSLAASATVTMVVTVSGSTKTVTVKGTTSSGTFLSGQLQV